jgi:hypothetical protein
MGGAPHVCGEKMDIVTVSLLQNIFNRDDHITHGLFHELAQGRLLKQCGVTGVTFSIRILRNSRKKIRL